MIDVSRSTTGIINLGAKEGGLAITPWVWLVTNATETVERGVLKGPEVRTEVVLALLNQL